LTATAAWRVGRLAVAASSSSAVSSLAGRLETALRLAPQPVGTPGEIVIYRQISLGELRDDLDVHALTARLAAALAAVRPIRLRAADPEVLEASAGQLRPWRRS
jgi:hypothetical protein